MSEEQSKNTLTDIVKTSVNRRTIIKGVAGAAAFAVGAHPKASRVFAAPNVLQAGPVSITYSTWFWNEPGRAKAWRDLITKFHAEQADIRIQEAGAPFNQYTDDIIIQLQAGKLGYDLVQTTPDLVLRLIKAGVTTPLGSVLKANKITTLSKAHDYITVDGEPHGLDVVTVVFGLLYNKKIFDDAGVTKLPTTTDEWLATSTQLTKRPNAFGMWAPHLMAESDSFWFTLQEWACAYGGTWATGKTPNLTTEPIMKAVSLFKKFYDASFPQGSDDATATRQWAQNQLGQELIVSAAVNIFKTTAPEVYPNIRSMPLPWESKQSIARIHPITVNNTSKNAQAGVEFVTWLYKPENYRLLLMGQLDVIPSYDVGGLDAYLKDLPWLDGYKDITYKTPPEMVGEFIFNNSEFGQIVLPHVQDVLSDTATVDVAMAAAQKEAEDLATRLEK
ncbi:MAG: ABC transporter substrate-binding protein [Thermomicrobiales bacterium]